MTSHVGAMNSHIVRQTHSIFSLFLWLCKVNHKVIAKFSCLPIITWKNSKTLLVIAARLHHFSYPFTKKRPSGYESHSDEKSLFFYI